MITEQERLEWLRSRVSATVGTEFELTHDACAWAIHAIETLAKVRRSLNQLDDGKCNPSEFASYVRTLLEAKS